MSPRLLTILGGSDRERMLLRELAALEAVQIEPVAGVGRAIRVLAEEDPPAAVLAGIDQRSPGFLELLATVDARELRIPVLATTNGGIVPDLVVDTGPTFTLLDLGRPPEDLVTRVSSALSTSLASGCWRNGIDYLLPAILSGRSVSLNLRLSADHQVLVELVGGDVWNVYAADLEAEAALESILFEPVSQVEIQTLQTIPGERHICRSGVEALGSGSRGARRDGRSTRGKDHDLGTQEICPIELIADLRSAANAPPPSSDVAAADAETPAAIEDPVADRFDSLFSAGLEAALARDYPRAAQAFEEALDLRPNEPRVRHNLDRVRRHLTD